MITALVIFLTLFFIMSSLSPLLVSDEMRDIVKLEQ